MQKRTKIVATIGPASAEKETLRKMIEGGMNVARINFSHGDHESNGKLISLIKELREEMNLPIAVMADLQGPRIRVMIENDLEIQEGENVLVGDSQSKISDDEKYFLLDKDVLSGISVGNEILVEDGRLRFEVIEKKEDCLLTKTLVSGTVKNHKGVNVPDARLSFGALTEKDEKDLEFVLSEKVDFVALSFVGDKSDVEKLREKIKAQGSQAKIVSKIERKKAIENIDEIIEATDCVMVARGDLGIELPETKVVVYQKEIIEKCLTSNKPVIVATQMLESMIENPLPTRAEVSDVSNAVIDHADAVMLSGESANGKYPVETVSMMAQIIRDTEDSRFDDSCDQSWCQGVSGYGAIVNSAYRMAKDTNAKAILMFSFSGLTAQMMSKHRPERFMLVATQASETFFQTAILWGIEAFLMSDADNIDNFSDFLMKKGKEKEFLASKDKVVIIIGKLPDGRKMRLVGIEEVE